MHHKTKIYLDTCCLCRPYDRQTEDRVVLESEAILSIIDRCETKGDWLFYSSDVLDDEIDRIVHLVKKQKVRTLYHSASIHIELNDEIVEQAKKWAQTGMTPFDALHLSSAEYVKADVLLTTDKKFIKQAKRLNLKTRVENPLVWMIEVIHEY